MRAVPPSQRKHTRTWPPLLIILILALAAGACRFGAPASSSGQAVELPAAIRNIPRSQILKLEGWESTNPHDYDPATVRSSGGNTALVFSGLVSFNPTWS